MNCPARAKQLFLSLLDKGMRGSYCMRTTVGRESVSKCIVSIVDHSRSTTTCSHHRFLSSARPLPDDDHGDISWRYDDETQIREFIRAPPLPHPKRSRSDLKSSTLTPIPSIQVKNGAFTSIGNRTVQKVESNEVASNMSLNKLNIEGYSVAEALKSSDNPNDKEIHILSEHAVEHVEFVSPSTLRYTGDAVIPITSLLHIVKPQDDTPRGVWPVFRLLVSRS